MIRKILFIVLLLNFSATSFLKAQNMWEEFHLSPSVSNISFTGKYAWLNFDFGTIRLDTTNWSYEYFNSNNRPELALSNGLVGNFEWPGIKSVNKSSNGGLDFFESFRSLNYDGANFNEQIYPTQSSPEDKRFYDSSGVLWNANYFSGWYGYGDLTFNQSGTWAPFYNGVLLAIDTNNCLITADGLGGYYRVCSPNMIDTFFIPIDTSTFNLFGNSTSCLKIDSKNNQWYWIPDSLKLYKYDGINLTSYGTLSFPNGDTPFVMLPLKDNSVIFTDFYHNNIYSKSAVIFNSGNYIDVDTSMLAGPYDYAKYFSSPNGRIFSVISGNEDTIPARVFTSLDGVNWQGLTFQELNVGYTYSNYNRDSIGNVFACRYDGYKQFGNNWIGPSCILWGSYNFNDDYCVSSNGICWAEEILDSLTCKFIKWNSAINQIDSSCLINFSQPYSYSQVIGANDNRFWVFKNSWLLNQDSIFEIDNSGILHSYFVPTYNANYWGMGSNYQESYQRVIGNSFYSLIFFANYDSGRLYKFENGIEADLCPNGIPKITSFQTAKDHQNNLWCASRTALYKYDGTAWDSIPLPFPIINNSAVINNPVISFNDQDELFILIKENNSFLNTHLYKYTNPAWTEYPIPTPVTFGEQFFFKDGFFWTFNGESLLRFNQNGFPNTLSSSYIVKGKAYHDLNANNIQNTNESGKQNVLIQSSSGDFSFTQYYGNYLLLPDSGQNTITCTPPLYYTVTPATVTVNNTGANPVVDSVDFALQPLPGMNDLSVDVTHYPFISWNTNPGISYWLTVKNPGTTVQSATLTFNVPDTLVIAYVYPTPSSTNGNQLTWSLSNMAIDTSLQFYIAASFQLPTPIGSILVAIAEVQSANTDLTPANNIDTVSYLVTGPYDPNMKLVDPRGEGALGITDTTHHVFTYTIYFQNTGNDTAVNVRVDDFLDADFDWTSFNLISSSSPVDFDLNQNGLLRFHFNNIFLPDSNVNEPMSHGFVKYSLRLKPGPSLGKQLTNAASIYFDYQPPIFTNSTLNTIGMETGIGAVSYNSNSVTLFPNPSGGLVTVLSNGNKMKFFSVYDLSGRLCYTQEASTNQATINIQSLAQGLYLVKIKLQNGTTELKKLVKE